MQFSLIKNFSPFSRVLINGVVKRNSVNQPFKITSNVSSVNHMKNFSSHSISQDMNQWCSFMKGKISEDRHWILFSIVMSSTLFIYIYRKHQQRLEEEYHFMSSTERRRLESSKS